MYIKAMWNVIQQKVASINDTMWNLNIKMIENTLLHNILPIRNAPCGKLYITGNICKSCASCIVCTSAASLKKKKRKIH